MVWYLVTYRGNFAFTFFHLTQMPLVDKNIYTHICVVMIQVRSQNFMVHMYTPVTE
jgi:hypothetical protein